MLLEAATPGSAAPADGGVGAVVVDDDGRIQTCDAAAAALLGGDAQGLRLSDLVSLRTLERCGGEAEMLLHATGTPLRATYTAPADGVRTMLVRSAPIASAAPHSAFLLQLADRLRGVTDPGTILAATGEALGRHLGVSRVGYGEVDATEQWLIIERDWTDGVRSLIGRHPLPLGSSISDAYRRGETVASEDLRSVDGADPHERALLIAMGIAGSVAVPLMKNGRLAAFMAAQHHAPRGWSPDEIRLVEDVAERTWATLEHARTETRLRDSEEQFRLLAENMPSICWLGDAAGRPIWYNRRGHDFFGSNDAPVGDLIAVCDPGELPVVTRRWQAAIRAGEALEIILSLKGGDGSFRPFLSRTEPVRDADGRVARWCGIVTDLSEQRAAERRHALLGALAERLRNEPSTDAILGVTAELLGRHLGAARVAYFDADAGEARRFHVGRDWTDGSVPSIVGQHRHADLADALDAAHRRGETLVADDVAHHPLIGTKARRVFARIGLRAGIDVPLIKDGALVGLLGVHHASPRRWTPDEVSLVEEVAERTWAALTRARAEERLAAHHRDQRFLLAWSDAMRGETDPHAILAATTRAVGEYLGLSRVFYAEADAAGDRMAVEAEWADTIGSSVELRDALVELGTGGMADHLKGRPFHTADVRIDPRFDAAGRAACAAIKVAAFVRVPLIRQGAVAAVFAMQQATARHWTEGEIALLKDVAERVWAILQRARSEERLRESEALLAAFMDNAPVGMSLTDADGRYIRLNPEMAKALGVPAEQALGRTIAELVSPESARRIAALDGRTRAGRLEATELNFGDRDPYGSALVIRFPVAAGPARRTGGFAIDITARKRAEAALARSRDALYQSEKMTALGSLLAGVSHELNNPLSIVVGHSVMLEQQGAGTPFGERAAKIRKAAYRCARIVQSFLAIARQKTPERAPVMLNEVIEAALELTEYGLRADGIEVMRALAPDLPALMADADQLHQIIINLVVNAQQAMQDAPAPRRLAITTRAGEDGCSVVLDMADSGPGVPPEARRRIFEPFFTTKPQGAGTGIGLSFSQGLAEAHGGTLVLLDTATGATFRLTLPTDQGGAAPEEDGVATVPAHATTRRALVIDDEPEIAETLADFLSMEGFVCEVAEGGGKARRLLADADYDLIVSDLRMPDLDGPTLFGWLAEARPALVQRVAFVTGDTLGAHASGFLGQAGRPVIEKPFTPESVRRLIEQLGAAS